MMQLLAARPRWGCQACGVSAADTVPFYAYPDSLTPLPDSHEPILVIW